MRRTPSRAAHPRRARDLVIGTWTPEFTVGALARINPAAISTGLPAANDPYAYPFRLSELAIARQLLLFHGTAAGGNFDMGIYTSAWARLVSTGSVAAVGNNLWQAVDVTDTPLEPFRVYYLVITRDNATANRQRSFSGSLTVSQCQLAGVNDSTIDAFPLPDPLTNMALAAAISHIPCMGIACKVPY